eukprot:TRINITY_DN4071_c1_g1_i3.p1 TRINITY_DN4071_c1_g1~~TRINITY_DN4071_c1_g1_i3.p1  ORF type:complete len:487 (+),score=121.27 TRINITY_DN4071_c1_g1_i3:1239-2699(+)
MGGAPEGNVCNNCSFVDIRQVMIANLFVCVDCVFANSTTVYVGAPYSPALIVSAMFVCERCEMRHNIATSNLVDISKIIEMPALIAAGQCVLIDCIFRDNMVFLPSTTSAPYLAGGVINATVSLTAYNTSFLRNTFVTPYVVSYGGAIAVVPQLPSRIDQCTFVNNSATYGGAIALPPASAAGQTFSSLTIVDCLFVNNSAAKSGGALLASVQNDVVIINSTFHNNIAGHCGGAVAVSNVVMFQQCTFVQNSAGSGGAIGAQFDATYSFDSAIPCGTNSLGNVLPTVQVEQCSFTANMATQQGGALFIPSHAQSELLQCEFADNSAYYYGANIASEPVQLLAKNISTMMNNALRLHVNVADVYNHTCVYVQGIDVLVKPLLSGDCQPASSSAVIKNGVAIVPVTSVVAPPGIVVQFQATAAFLSSAQFTAIAGTCSNGFGNANTTCGLQCVPCANGLYNLSPDSGTCELCPKHCGCQQNAVWARAG